MKTLDRGMIWLRLTLSGTLACRDYDKPGYHKATPPIETEGNMYMHIIHLQYKMVIGVKFLLM